MLSEKEKQALIKLLTGNNQTRKIVSLRNAYKFLQSSAINSEWTNHRDVDTYVDHSVYSKYDDYSVR